MDQPILSPQWGLQLQITPRQHTFITAKADEVLFGGAAGGGKSWAQLIDALLYALTYPGSRQLVLRRTFPDLERSLILVHYGLYPRAIYRYNAATHRGTFANGSTVEFGYCDSENDVYRYQGAEYDVIRFDELTHFTQQMYIYLISRVRGANSYPKGVKSTTNPGGVGHAWVKQRFIDTCPPRQLYRTHAGTRLFLPSKIFDNPFLLKKDPAYLKRLENLAEKDRRALLQGDWDVFEGQYFTEWRREAHVVKAHEIDKNHRRYFVMDYGLDMLAGYWIALDERGRATVYREIYESGLIISQAAARIQALSADEDIYAYLAPADLWNRRQDTGRSVADIFAQQGMFLQKAQNTRISGWLDLREWLRCVPDETGAVLPSLRIMENCVNLIRCMPLLQYDSANPTDAATQPHEITHSPDALRYFAA
ncbi:MAG: terminase family protein, partial [Pygmaiobacter sp.]|nr:terminase family protein [Pygmaiobacter sp.]